MSSAPTPSMPLMIAMTATLTMRPPTQCMGER